MLVFIYSWPCGASSERQYRLQKKRIFFGKNIICCYIYPNTTIPPNANLISCCLIYDLYKKCNTSFHICYVISDQTIPICPIKDNETNTPCSTKMAQITSSIMKACVFIVKSYLFPIVGLKPFWIADYMLLSFKL